MHREKILTRFLLPIDQSRHSARVVGFAGRVLPALGTRCQDIILLHVLGGGYLSTHLKNVDMRAKFLVDSEKFKDLRTQYIDQEIRPFMDDFAQRLQSVGAPVAPEILILDGDPAHEILSLVRSRDISTVIMGRRGLNALEGIIFGSITDALLHADMEASLYIVGRGPDDQEDAPPSIRNILVAVDGAEHSISAVEEAGLLERALGSTVEQVAIMNVVDITNLAYEIQTGSEDMSQRTRDILIRARAVLAELGVPDEKIVTVSRCGRPVDCILEEAGLRNSDIIYLGRRGGSGLRTLIPGSVARTVVSRSPEITVALVGKITRD